MDCDDVNWIEIASAAARGKTASFVLPRKAMTIRLPARPNAPTGKVNVAAKRLKRQRTDFLEVLKRERSKMAKLSAIDPAFLPFFKRFEDEIVAHEAQDTALAKALAN